MNILKKHLRDYLQLRRALGFELGESNRVYAASLRL